MFKTTTKILIAWAFTISLICNSFAQTSNDSAVQSALDSVVTILLANQGQANSVGSGLIVRSDGYVLTAYNLVKGAREIQIRLHNGEIYDKAEIISIDERRNVALLHVKAAGLRVIPAAVESEQVGARIIVVANSDGQAQVDKDKLLNSIQLADTIAGAGNGFRVLQFDALGFPNAAGGLLLDETGRALGIVTTNPNIKNQNIAVPLSSIIGLINAAPLNNSSTASAVYVSSSPLPVNAPAQTNNSQTETRKVFSRNPQELLANSKIVSVTSRTTFFKDQQLINELMKRDTIKQWGWLFLDGSSWDNEKKADLIIELDHQILTYNFTFTIRHRETGIVLAAGKVIIGDGASGAPQMVDRMIEKLSKSLNPKPIETKDKKDDAKKKSN